MKIILVALFAQELAASQPDAAQNNMDKLTERARQVDLSEADLEATTLAKVAAAMMPASSILSVPPASAHVYQMQPAKPNVEFVLPAKEYVKKDKQSAYEMLKSKDPNMQAYIDAAKANCYTKNCGSAQGKFAERPLDVINIPAVALVCLLVGSGVTFAMRRFRKATPTAAEEAFLA